MPLVFGEKKINKISGPVSMYILKPSKLKQKEFPNLPLIILFGDIHLGNEYMCTEEHDVKGENDTFKIYDVNFLKLFNDCVDDGEKIDFYVEGGDLHAAVRAKNQNDYPLVNLKNLFSECYINPRSTVNTMSGKQLADYQHTKDHCNLIPKIRWQSGDIRFFYDPESKNKKFGATIERLLKKITCNFTDKDLTGEDLKKVLTSLNKNPSSHEITDITTPEEKLDNLQYLITQLQSIGGIEPIEVSKELENIVLVSDGLIQKEMDKMPDSTRNKLKKYIYEYFSYTYTNTVTNKLEYMKLIIEFQRNFIKLVLGYLINETIDSDSLAYFNRNKKLILKYYVFIIQKYGIITEIFTLCRILKYLTYEEVPIINIIYYGDLHIQNIYYFLTRISGLYDCELSIGRKEYPDASTKKTSYNRCIEILSDINIGNLIVEVKKNFKREDVLALPTLSEDLSEDLREPLEVALQNTTPVKHRFRTNKLIERRRSNNRSKRKKSIQKKERSRVRKSIQKKERSRVRKPSPKKRSRARKSSPKKRRISTSKKCR